ncbi:MAG: MATE family efflux transporter [Halanaerobium sp.]|nr:MATE family efflux transporter [Halanaerobium sp.]
MTFEEKQELILKGDIIQAIKILAVPIMLNNFIQTIYNLTDTFWVSKIGAVEVAAITLIWPVIFLSMSLGVGINIAGNALISQYTGSQQKKRAAKVAGQILSFSIIFSSILAVLGYFLAPYIISLMGGEGELYNKAVAFLQIIFIGMPTMFSFFAFFSIKQGQGDTVTPMKFSAAAVTMNIILDPIFIFTLNMGIEGAAWATVISRSIFSAIAIFTLFTSREGIKLHLKDLHLNREILSNVIKIGIPSSIGQSTAALGFSVLNAFIVSFGSTTLAAFGIGNRINSLILMPAMGVGNALATIVGQNLGAEQVDRAKEAIKKSILISITFLAVGGITVFFLSEKVIGLFTDNPEVLAQGTYYLKLISISIPLMGIFQSFVGTFQGSGHTLSAMLVMGGRLWGIRIPLILLFKNYYHLGPSSVWYAMVLSNALICLISYGIFLTGNWQHKVIKERKIIKPDEESYVLETAPVEGETE